MRTKTYQINNLKVVWSEMWGRWQVRTLQGVTLEEFRLLPDAKAFAAETHDFVKH